MTSSTLATKRPAGPRHTGPVRRCLGCLRRAPRRRAWPCTAQAPRSRKPAGPGPQHNL